MTSTPGLEVTAAGERHRRWPIARTGSIRSRWNRSFGLVLVVLAVGGLVSIGGSRRVVSEYRNRAERLEAEATQLATLRADLATHTRIAQSLIDLPDPVAADEASDRATSIEVSFRRAIDQSADTETRRQLERARSRWQKAIATIAGVQQGAPLGTRGPAHLAIAEHSDATATMLDAAGAAGRAAARAGLDRARRAQQTSTGVSLVVLGTVLVLVFRLGRRLSADILRPMSRLRESADRLAAGDLEHRAALGRGEFGSDDELAALVVSFNAMADAVSSSHHLLARQAHHDSLTDLANRAAFRARLEAAMSHRQRRAGTQAVLFIDLDDFKDVNDTLGHSAGDEVLTVVADRLHQVVRAGDLAARLGGDEFAVLLDGVTDPAAALAVAERAVATLALPMRLGDGSLVHVSASVGLAIRHDDSHPDGLMHEADTAMYLAKGRGKNRVERYDVELDAAAVDHRLLKTQITGAERRGELVVEYQPIVDLDSGAVVGSEALVRWQHPTRGLLPPSEFIPLAESTGAIIDIGSWVLHTALGQLRRWQCTYDRPDLVVSVNVSVHQLGAGFAERVEQLLLDARVDPARLVLEVTESVLADTAGPAATTLAALRHLGVRVALDDFGTGYSSIGYLRRLPVDILKIDRSFVSGDHTDCGSDVLLEAIVGLAQRLGLDVVAEGIEEPRQLARLRALGCRNGQGFLLSRPVAPHVVDQFLAEPAPFIHGEVGAGT